jgi:hypothetical protein
MAHFENLFTSSEHDKIASSVEHLRRMKDAATIGLEQSWSQRVKSLFSRTNNVDISSPDRQLPLKAAEALASTTASFLVARISKGSYQEELEALGETVERAQQEYGNYKGISYTSIPPSAVAERIAMNLQYLDIDPDYVLAWHMTRVNNIGYSNLNTFLNQNVGIISPLATDYLTAALYRKFIVDQMGKNEFLLHPAATSRQLQGVVLPKNSEGERVYQNVDEIAVFLDIITTGSTGRAVLERIKQQYPDKKIHEFSMSIFTDKFVPSDKIRRALNRQRSR